MFLVFVLANLPYIMQLNSGINIHTYTNTYTHADVHRPTRFYMHIYIANVQAHLSGFWFETRQSHLTLRENRNSYFVRKSDVAICAYKEWDTVVFFPQINNLEINLMDLCSTEPKHLWQITLVIPQLDRCKTLSKKPKMWGTLNGTIYLDSSHGFRIVSHYIEAVRIDV
jgi:hypothetical protein